MGGQIANFFRVASKDPQVGDGATIFHYTDRSAATVVRVSKSGKTAWIQADRAIRTDENGMSESQSYRFEPNPKGNIVRVSKRKNGEWRMSRDVRKVAFGYRDAYHDYSF